MDRCKVETVPVTWLWDQHLLILMSLLNNVRHDRFTVFLLSENFGGNFGLGKMSWKCCKEKYYRDIRRVWGSPTGREFFGSGKKISTRVYSLNWSCQMLRRTRQRHARSRTVCDLVGWFSREVNGSGGLIFGGFGPVNRFLTIPMVFGSGSFKHLTHTLAKK